MSTRLSVRALVPSNILTAQHTLVASAPSSASAVLPQKKPFSLHSVVFLFFFNDTATTEIYTLSSHLGISYAVFCLKKKINLQRLRFYGERIIDSRQDISVNDSATLHDVEFRLDGSLLQLDDELMCIDSRL